MYRNGETIDDRLWNIFAVWAEDYGVSDEHENDWGPWWDCWKAGYDCAYEDWK